MKAWFVVLAVLAALGAAVLATADTTAALLCAAGAVAVAATWRRPEVLVVGVAALVPSGHFAVTLRVPVAGTYLTALQVTVFAVAALAVAARPAADVFTGPAVQVGAAVAVAGVAAATTSADPLGSLYWVVNLGLLMVALSAVLHRRIGEAQAAVHRCVVLAGLILAAVCIVEGVTGRALLGGFYTAHVPNFTAGGAGFRAVATVGNPLVASTALAGVYTLALVSEHIRFRVAVLAVLAGGVFASLSRSSISLMVAATAAYALFGWAGSGGRHRRVRQFVAVAGVPAVLGAAWLVLPRLSARLGRSGEVFTDPARAANAARAVHLWWSVNPLTGLGFGGFKRLMAEQLPAGEATAATVDNMFLSLLVDAGVVGVVVVLAAVVVVVRSRRRGGPVLPLLVLVAAGLFLDVEHQDLTVALGVVFLADWWLGARTGGPADVVGQVRTAPPTSRFRLPTGSRTGPAGSR